MDRNIVIEVILDGGQLRSAMWAYSRQVLGLSIFISITTAALVYASLQWLAVRPLRRITGHIVAFRAAPEDRTLVLDPPKRGDEVGRAEAALAEMQGALRLALTRKERLAGVGAAVTRISHDLKNVLATAMLESERLAAHGDAHTQDMTAGIARSLDRAVALAKSTLQFAQGDLPEPDCRKAAIMPLLEETAASIQNAFPDCRITVDGDQDATAFMDGALVLRAIDNLARNAAEAGAHHVCLSVQGNPPAVAIADDGPGFSPRALENLFVPFAGSARPGGSGLGLPIAREVLRAQGGDVVLEKTSPAGTTFIVRLPPHETPVL